MKKTFKCPKCGWEAEWISEDLVVCKGVLACRFSGPENEFIITEEDNIIKILMEIGRGIKTQDNMFTDQPMFVVEEAVYIPTDPDYGYDLAEWAENKSGDYHKATETQAARLELLHEGMRDTGKWEKHYSKKVWQFVTCCFTEKGCHDYLKINRHNLGEIRIYAYGSFRNKEYQDVRNFLIKLGEEDEA